MDKALKWFKSTRIPEDCLDLVECIPWDGVDNPGGYIPWDGLDPVGYITGDGLDLVEHILGDG